MGVSGDTGIKAVTDYLIQEVQRVYRLQGIDINDKHIEVIVRQMIRKIKVEEAGDTNLLIGSVIDRAEFLEEYKKAAAAGGALPECTRVLLGIHITEII